MNYQDIAIARLCSDNHRRDATVDCQYTDTHTTPVYHSRAFPFTIDHNNYGNIARVWNCPVIVLLNNLFVSFKEGLFVFFVSQTIKQDAVYFVFYQKYIISSYQSTILKLSGWNIHIRSAEPLTEVKTGATGVTKNILARIWVKISEICGYFGHT